jgi:tripartite-type tricarboxylate transporter receptor subunit TctC
MQRRLLLQGIGAGAALGFSATARAQAAWPSQQVKLIVPYSPGGLPDTVARILSKKLSERFSQAVVVENRPGANGVVAAQAVIGAAHDGHTLMLTDDSMITINPLLYKNLGYEPRKDFVPTSLIATAPLFLAVHPSVPANTFAELVALIKSKPNEFAYGSSGVGSTHHLCTEAMKAALGLEIRHIPYKGTSQSVPALVGNQVSMVFSAFPSLTGFVKGGQVKLLVVNTAKRSPAAVIARLSEEVARLVKDPEVMQTFNTAGIEGIGGSPADYVRVLEREAERDARAIRLAGLKPE